MNYVPIIINHKFTEYLQILHRKKENDVTLTYQKHTIF